MITCKACGTQNPSDSAFCANCARKLDPETQDAVVAQRAAHAATGVRWSSIVISVVVLLIILAAVLLLVTHTL